ncbi:hypothetical protein [Photorhabdus sp. SF281]|uniref:hypothetical protein n=1 Tax=Photorhabdus sp. SF281 TaxID=3459527 RepID=UPI004044BBF3
MEKAVLVCESGCYLNCSAMEPIIVTCPVSGIGEHLGGNSKVAEFLYAVNIKMVIIF